ncbi:hypothetical protein CPB84DRAFT_1851837 [Gymnopilus junonius]|uniref:RING-type domain-containing protein n=1 Tax=Gymnopilus junonius TaxID=109634 RepID=A0A9P5NDJ5_GYMJU|nr:hypothetical protein CPB84DRAFT_1851837 [Gymnopilus junonius]
MSRSTKAQPVTPQRLPRHQPRSHSFYRSPLTPSASPYTPISLRSMDSTGSSTLTTPENIGGSVKKRLAFSAGSPGVVRNASMTQDRSLADIAENWRSRANENGIKVSLGPQEESHYVPDDSSDMSLSDVANDSSIISTEEALLAAPFLSTHRRLNSLPITNRPRAQSHASLPSSRLHPLSPVTSRINNRPPQTSSPLQSRRTMSTSFSQSASLMSTPPPNRTLARQLKLKGSLTDPVPPRKREAFGTPSTPYNLGHRSANMSVTLEPDTSLDLFDIDENDYEYDHEYQDGSIENSFSRNLEALQNNNFGYPTFVQPIQQAQSHVFHQPHFADPFQAIGTPNGLVDGHVLNGITDSLEHRFHVGRQQPVQSAYYDDRIQPGSVLFNPVPRFQHQFNQGMPRAYPTPTFVPMAPPQLPFHHQHSLAVQPQVPYDRSFSPPTIKSPFAPSTPELSPTDCSVCLAANPASLAILQPCKHPLCSACLTSALNIVGEKDMECAVCKKSVLDFKLVMGTSKGSSGSRSSCGTPKNDTHPLSEKATLSDMAGRSFMEPISPVSSTRTPERQGALEELQSAFEFGLELGDLRASTPKHEKQTNDFSVPEDRSHAHTTLKRDIRRNEDNVVLRIDNVPWDITPRQIIHWLSSRLKGFMSFSIPKARLSVMRMLKSDAAIAGAILRGETLASNASGKKERGSVLGRGRRARGVTVTRSGQQELMSDVPLPPLAWRFRWFSPIPRCLEGDRLIGALEGGLLTEHEISSLLYLIREPDSHFLKVPSLPFHSLISILSKFPTDVDSRVFWSANVRDALSEATYAAIQVLLPRVENAKQDRKLGTQEEEFTMDLVVALLHTALDCQAFTTQQILRLKELAQASSLPVPDADFPVSYDDSASSSFSISSSVRTPSSQDNSTAVIDRSKLNNSQVFEDLAREFNLDAQRMPALLEALTQRLAQLS